MPLSWATLAPSLLSDVAWGKADPYLRLADGTGYVDHLAAPPQDGAWLPVSVQWVDKANKAVIDDMVVLDAPAPADAWFTARVKPAALSVLLTHPAVQRVQWAEGLLAQRPRTQYATPWPLAAAKPPPPRPGSGTPVLLGVIDAGCPFAHADLRRAGGATTRVVRLWDQQGGPADPPPQWGYGSEWGEDALNALMADATDAHGRLDEHLCYMRAGADQVLGRTSHGAHALGLLAGPRLVDGRPARRDKPPSRLLTGEVASADIAFVQLPRKLLDSAFPPAVEHHVLNGLRYLVDVAAQRQAARLFVSFAFESWLGPHDGSSWFGQAVDALVTEASTRGVALSLTVIAGNAGDDGVHRTVASVPAVAPDTGHVATVHWHQPPVDETVTLLELWLPDGAAPADLTLSITPPGDAGSLPPVAWGDAKAWPSDTAPAIAVVMDRSRTLGVNADVMVLRVSPTQTVAPRRGAPHGEWRLELRSAQPLQGLHAYIGRCTESMNSPPRGRQAAFTRRTAGERLLDRQGTLSGFANHPAARVATACVSDDWIYRGDQAPAQPGGAAPYAGFGPSRDGVRPGPSFGVVVEHGLYHQGMVGIGNRSGTVFRMVGTSVAAPLGARHAASQPEGSPEPRPPPVPPERLREVGSTVQDPLLP